MAILAALSRAIETRDPYTCGHSTRVTRLAEALARRLGWNEDRLAALEKEDQIDKLLAEIKARRGVSA